MADLGWTGPGAVVADGAQAAQARRANADRDGEQRRIGIAATDSPIRWAGAGPRAKLKMRSRPFGREIGAGGGGRSPPGVRPDGGR